ncbi:hypothetical protein [Parabacteroides sp. AM08-6]|uniref:hypothetical protein n=1 Tax=Parabacteroides sp. AM08-6 TaxID=2292053 RepID=UPI000EFFB289|nr:hypothetical protein [Parabacteroides sp. AM08-6]RHJ79130.1 hypothetical protein DW103_14125 [Parabacteroides sp. AM08-6]
MNKIINIDIFCRDLMVHFGNRKELKDVLKRYCDKQTIKYVINEIDFSAKGYTLCNSNKKVLIVYMPTKPYDSKSMGFLIHELLHVTNCIMEEIGVEPSESSEEAYAYLIGFLTRRIIDEFSISLS